MTCARIWASPSCPLWSASPEWVASAHYSDTQCTGALDVLTDTIIPAQFSVANASLHPEFVGTVSAVETRHFHREAKYSPGNQCYHWNNNCESYWRVGQAMGKGMLQLISGNAGA